MFGTRERQEMEELRRGRLTVIELPCAWRLDAQCSSRETPKISL